MCAGLMLERMFKIIYSSPYASHETTTFTVDKMSWDVRLNSVPRWHCFGIQTIVGYAPARSIAN